MDDVERAILEDDRLDSIGKEMVFSALDTARRVRGLLYTDDDADQLRRWLRMDDAAELEIRARGDHVKDEIGRVRAKLRDENRRYVKSLLVSKTGTLGAVE